MTFRKLILATAVLATASGYAFAQVPTERTGSKTDNTLQQMNKDRMNKDQMGQDKMKSGTTGSGMNRGSSTTGSGATSDKANGQMLNKNVSPSSQDSGLKQQK